MVYKYFLSFSLSFILFSMSFEAQNFLMKSNIFIFILLFVLWVLFLKNYCLPQVLKDLIIYFFLLLFFLYLCSALGKWPRICFKAWVLESLMLLQWGEVQARTARRWFCHFRSSLTLETQGENQFPHFASLFCCSTVNNCPEGTR